MLLLSLITPLHAADENDYYRLLTIPIPEGLSLEVGGIAVMPNQRLAVCTRRGDVWLIDGAYDPQPTPEKVKFTRFASGLHEPLGITWRDGSLYVTQRAEVTRLRDTNSDDRADEYATVAAGWGVTGAYHEYAYGPVFDKAGNLYVTLNCSMGEKIEKSNDLWRGWSLRFNPAGELQPWSAGMRSPSGIGTNAAGDVFFTDQQGTWVATCSLHHIQPGDFHGYAEKDVLKFASLPGSPVKTRAALNKVPVAQAAREIEGFKLPAVWFPYRKMGMSATGFAADVSGGKFGPFENQLFVGDFTMSLLTRVYLEKVRGHYQGAVFRFREGFQCAAFRVEQGGDGSMFVGQTNRGWNSLGTRSFGLQRLVWTGKTPFEIATMQVQPDGFLLTFTLDVDAKTAADPASYEMNSYTYEYHATYGSEEIDARKLNITRAEVLSERQVKLTVEGLREVYVHELRAAGVKSAAGDNLLHDVACYTLNRLP